MNKLVLSFIFIFGALVFSYAQYPSCTLIIVNTTASTLVVGGQTTINTPNQCGVATTDFPETTVLPGETETIDLGIAILPDPPIRPFRIGCYDITDTGTASWQINTCWNPACVDSSEPAFDIQFTSCEDYTTLVTII